MTIRRVFTALGILMVLLVALFWYWQLRSQAQQALPHPASAVQPRNGASRGQVESVIADGVVVPSRRANLSFTAGGTLTVWFHAEGATVASNALLAKLSSPQLAQTVALAEAEQKLAEARLERAKNGPQPHEIAAAEAAVAASQARITLAEAELEQATVNLAVTQAQVDAAAAGADGALARLQEAERGPTEEEVRSATARLRQAEAGVRQAQAAYDRVATRSEISSLPESRMLEEATNGLDLARAEYDRIMKGATEEQLAQLRADYRRAQAELQQTQTLVLASETAVLQARANVTAAVATRDQAQAELDLLREGTRPEDIAALEAELARAKSALMQARLLEEQTVLRAPFDGVIVQRMVRAGEVVVPNQPVAQFGDLSTLQIETDDLDEVDAALVHEGQLVNVIFDALPDVQVPGQVAAVRRIAEDKRGETTFTVFVTLDEIPNELLWGMTATVEVDVRQ
jgi:HlyD family secretion protein